MSDDPICLSSDDEYEPATKRPKTVPMLEKEQHINGAVNGKKAVRETENIICLDSDEDNDSQDVVIVNSKENNEVETTKPTKNNGVDTAECNQINEVDTSKVSKSKEVDDSNRVEVISCDSPLTLNLSIASSGSGKDGEDGVSDNDSSATEYFEEVELKTKKEENGEIENSENQPEASTFKESDLMADTEDLPKEAISFLSTCIEVLRKSSAEPIFKKFPVIIKMFRSLSDEFARTEYLSKFLRKQTKIAKESVSCCIISFREVYLHLKDSLNSQSVELPKQHWKHVRKLEKTMELLLAKLKELEEEEIDFDDENEEESSYIKHDKYSQRLALVYKKYCEIMKKNPYAGRITHERLDFVNSNYNEINQAISKKYKNNKKFPSYDELAAYIQTVVDEKKLPLLGAELRNECELCFKKLGDLLQIRRKKELYEVHQQYILNEDPAKKDEELDRKLRISSKEGAVRIDQVCEQYVRKQDLGLAAEEDDLSESEKSNDSDDGDL